METLAGGEVHVHVFFVRLEIECLYWSRGSVFSDQGAHCL